MVGYFRPIKDAPRDGKDILILTEKDELYRACWEFAETSEWDGKQIYDFYLWEHDDWFGCKIHDGPLEHSTAKFILLEDFYKAFTKELEYPDPDYSDGE